GDVSHCSCRGAEANGPSNRCGHGSASRHLGRRRSSPMMFIILGGIAIIVIVLMFMYLTITKLLYVATPNEVLVFSGTTRRVNGQIIPYRFVRGGRSLRKPLLERVERVDLSMFTVMVSVEQAFTRGGIPLTVQGV